MLYLSPVVWRSTIASWSDRRRCCGAAACAALMAADAAAAEADAGVASPQMRSDGGVCASGLVAETRLMIYQLLSCARGDLACPSALSARPYGGGREEGSGWQRAAPIRTR